MLSAPPDDPGVVIEEVNFGNQRFPSTPGGPIPVIPSTMPPPVIVTSTASQVEALVVFLPGSVHGVKWHDTTPDGVQGMDEPGLGGFTVYADFNENGELDDDEPRTVTMEDDPLTAEDETGHYWLEVPPGSWLIREVVPSGWQQTFPNHPGVEYEFRGVIDGILPPIDSPWTQVPADFQANNRDWVLRFSFNPAADGGPMARIISASMRRSSRLR